MKFVLAFFLFLFSISPTLATNNVLIKANILKGEAFITANTKAEDIENEVGRILQGKGYHVLDKIATNGEYFLVDLFAYQFPTEKPTITLTIRSKNNVHYLDQEKATFFANRHAYNVELAARLAERIPLNIDRNARYMPSFANIIHDSPISSTGIISNTLVNLNRKNYSSSFIWLDYNAPDFLIPGGLPIYLMYASNYEGFRKQLKKNPIKLKLKISDSVRFNLLAIESQFSLTQKQNKRLQQLVDSFPLWTINEPIDNIELIFELD